MRRLNLLVLVLSGCMEVASTQPVIPKTVPPVPASNDLFSVAVEADETVVSTIFKYSGGSNAITLRSPLSLQFGDTGLSLPAGANLSYNFTELGGTVDFGSPKPVVSTKVLGATVHPILDRIVLRQPNVATAYARDMFGITHTKELELPELGKASVVAEVESEPESTGETVTARTDETGGTGKSTEAVPATPVQATPENKPEPIKPVPQTQNLSRPKLYFWTTSWGGVNGGYCAHCVHFKTDVSNYIKNGNTLPFDIVTDPKDFRPFDQSRPCFQWAIDGKVHRQVGYLGLDALIKSFKASQNPKKKLTIAEMSKWDGPTTRVEGMSVRYHLLNHHGFTPEQLAGLSEDQLKRIHSACHRNGD